VVTKNRKVTLAYVSALAPDIDSSPLEVTYGGLDTTIGVLKDEGLKNLTFGVLGVISSFE